MSKVIAVLQAKDTAAACDQLDDDTTFFYVDWREQDELIAESCESVLQTGSLRGELVEVDSGDGFEVHLQFQDRKMKVPLTYCEDDRHITLCTLNRLLAPEFEIRLCIDSIGADTLTFLPLPTKEWRELEKQYGPAVSQHFYQFADRPNLFTDTLPF